MILHTVNKSPFAQATLRSCLRVVSTEDSILLIEDGVYAALDDASCSELIQQLLPQVAVYALLPDLRARGIEDRIISGIQAIDYHGFVTLTEDHPLVQCWF
jgi:tRNA 2-thiouridine synthesizing protein B|tara:strand:+ start:3342 stop:3644 length:303 start_codon:yes stop_codon:yes gene_type:complete